MRTSQRIDLPALTELFIGRGSLIDVSLFELEELPSLHTIVIGSDATSLCFSGVQRAVFQSLPSLTQVHIGRGCFSFTEEVVIAGASSPSLSRIDNPKLHTFDYGVDSFFYARHFQVEKTPLLDCGRFKANTDHFTPSCVCLWKRKMGLHGNRTRDLSHPKRESYH